MTISYPRTPTRRLSGAPVRASFTICSARYLHNGSVSNLQELLLPAARRSKVLYMGNWDFDPVRVGYETSSPFAGASILDRRLPGNSNAGHEFGTDLSVADRAALIEYLKSL